MTEDHKVEIESLFLGEKVDIWYHGWQATNPIASGLDFSEELWRNLISFTERRLFLNIMRNLRN